MAPDGACVTRAPGGWTRVTPLSGDRVGVHAGLPMSDGPDCTDVLGGVSGPGSRREALTILRSMMARVLPNGRLDLLRQVVLFAAVYWAYRYTRGLVDDPQGAAIAFANARDLIDIERSTQACSSSGR